MASKSLQNNWESDLPSMGQTIQIRRGRKQNLYLQTISYLAQKKTSFGSFQPCLEDLLYLYGEDRNRADLAIKVLKRKEYLTKINIEVENNSKYIPDILVLSQKGTIHLDKLQENGLTEFEEWKQAVFRIKHLLNAPHLLFSSHPKASFFHVREIIRLIAPLLPSIPALDNDFIAKIVAFNKGKSISFAGLCQQILGFLDALLRLRGDYISSETLWNVSKTLDNYDLHVNLTKRKLYPHIQVGARLFGSTQRNLWRKDLFFKAVEKALCYYFMKFNIEEAVRGQILDIHNRLRAAGRISLDPEARALGIIGISISGFFLNENRNQFPLSPELWLAGRDQMHQIRKLFRKLNL
ncbi:MAG: hypothetical protein ACFFB3_05205 [Candidatus Hodarchaeota archaeon]